MLNSMIERIYTSVGVPLLIFIMRTLAKFNPKISEGLKMRESHNGVAPWLALPSETRPIWIHCASGEFEYAKPVITRLKKVVNAPVLVTYFSPSIKRAVETFPGVDMSSPLPWDTAEDWKSFFAHHRPRVLLIARTDTWPEMLKQTRLHKIPSLLFSATLVANSGRAKPLSRVLSKIVFKNLDEIYCVTQDDLEIFTDLGCGYKTSVIGDTRYDQVIARLQNPKPLSPFLKKDSPVLVAGSTWPEDEEQLVPALAKLKGRLRAILVPHEPHLDHVKELERLCERKGLSVERYSKLTSEWKADVLVIDQTGILAELYQLGTFAFVGGSFKKTVHSVMEPLAAGCPTFVGPLHLNNREAVSFQDVETPSGLPSVIVAQDVDDFARKLALLVDVSPSVLDQTRSFIKNEIQKRSNKSDAVVSWVRDHLD